MQEFSPAFPGLYQDDIVELDNVPYSEWPSLLTRYPRFRIRHENDDEVGYEQIVQVREGLILRTLDLYIKRDNRVNVCLPGGYVSFFVNMSGNYLIVEEGGEEHPHAEGTCGLVYEAKSDLVEDICRGGMRYVFVEVLIDRLLFSSEFYADNFEQMPQLLRNLYTKNCDHYSGPLCRDSNSII